MLGLGRTLPTGGNISVELGLSHERRDTETEADALEQVDGYLDKAGLAEGWIVMFDLRSTLPWVERLSTRTVAVNGKRVFVVGC